ncbi:polyribonucleotide nucleotidyltransferase [Streptococcus mutans LP13]|jgi:Predicted RNA binding protein (contains ribosomal protein S1 domain)|nr:putative polyribonucleotide nucleotidyltransferase [Streptococcus mutans]BBC56080.1 polyribonucleotide nucleotidyltransferase [Streptococcus mutans LP13]SUN72682.1 putative polyribonucleotide nucleotidyltransferase [Streptococcus mutans]VEF18620.1 putative polyribonucleotide nucleotidyltransferase [Streptococcus mutans]VTY49191.1 General stress protein 13 [Streptococcus mutans]
MMKIGDKLKGKITGIKPYGAFVQLENGSIGLIHISEIKTGYIDNIYQTLSVGQEVLVQVVDYDEYSQKASLSLRTLEEEKHHYQHRHRFSNNRLNIGFKPLEEHLPIWVEENLDYLKKDQDESDNQAKD